MPADGEGGSNSHTCYPYVLCSCCIPHNVPGANPFRGWPVKYVECERRGQCYGPYGGLATTAVEYVTAKDKRERKKEKSKGKRNEGGERGEGGGRGRGGGRGEKSKSDKRTFYLKILGLGKWE